MQKTILCYGDSNTWGFIPCKENYESLSKKRYPRDIRWPGKLQELLGAEYYVIEEGLNSRTTNADYHIPPERNGATYLPPCLYSHAPIDLVILALGGNDLKTYFNRSPNDVCDGMRALLDIVQQSNYGPKMQKSPQVLILSQIIPLPIAEAFTDEQGMKIFNDLINNCKALTALYKNLADERNCHFLDLSSHISPSSIDGIHLDDNAHKICATLLSEKIKSVFNRE